MVELERVFYVNESIESNVEETYASSQRLAEKRRWMTWSSSSDCDLRYESIILPMVVVRSAVTGSEGHEDGARSRDKGAARVVDADRET